MCRQLETGQKARGIGRAEGYIANDPASAVAAVDRQRGRLGIVARIEDPVFTDGRDLEVEFDITNEIFVGSVRGDHLDHEDRAVILPANLAEWEVAREVVKGRKVRLRTGFPLPPRHEHAGSAGDVVNDIRTVHGILP